MKLGSRDGVNWDQESWLEMRQWFWEPLIFLVLLILHLNS